MHAPIDPFSLSIQIKCPNLGAPGEDGPEGNPGAAGMTVNLSKDYYPNLITNLGRGR